MREREAAKLSDGKEGREEERREDRWQQRRASLRGDRKCESVSI